MTKYYLTHRGPNSRRNLAINATAFAASALVTLIFIVTEFTRGAWLVVVAIPLIVLVLTRTHRRYQEEKQVLVEDTAGVAAGAPVLRSHLVLVLVDSLDLASARALQLARSLALTGEVRAVHFVIDVAHAKDIERQWQKLGLSAVPLELFDCPDRRLARAATELVDDLAKDGQTEVVVVLPRRIYRGVANRIMHSHTADRIVTAVSTIPHVSATVAPFDVGGLLGKRRRAKSADWSGIDSPERVLGADAPKAPRIAAKPPHMAPIAGTTPVAELTYRQRMRFGGQVRSVRVQPLSGVPTLVCTVVDDSGAVNLVFLGRRAIPGIEPGSRIIAEGMVGRHGGRLAVINPMYQLLTPMRQQGTEPNAAGERS